MSIVRQPKYEFQVSQSISGSFNKGDTVEASFLAKGNSSTINQYIEQSVNLKYSVSSESISLLPFGKGTFPESFNISNQFVTKSFTAGIPTDIQYIEFTLSGSVDMTGSNTYNSGGAANYDREVEVNYDAFKIQVHTPKTELTDEGLLVFTSPNKFIKADSDGVEIKGGEIQAEKITTDTLEVFGDATIFGDVTATANSPYLETPQNVGTTATAGEESTFARGDHRHELVFDTLNLVAQEGDFTNISSSGTGSFGKVTIGTATTDHSSTQLTVNGGEGGVPIALFERTIGGTGEVAINMNSSDPQVRFFEDSNDKYAAVGVDATNSNLVFATGSIVKDKEAMVIQNDGGNVGIGNTNPQQKLTVDGDISSSGDLYLDGNDKSIYLGQSNLANQPYGQIRGTTSTIDILHPQGSYEAGIRVNTQGNIYFANVHDGSLDFNTDTKMILSMSRTANDPGGAGAALVGIGNINPTKTLTVEGDISSSGALRVSSILDADDAGASSTLSVDAQGILNIGTTQTDDINIGRQNNAGTHINLYANSSTPSIRIINKTIKFNNHITASGNISASNTSGVHSFGGKIGIGTSDPQELFHIASDSDPTLVIQNTGANQANSGKISFRESSATTERMNIKYDGADNLLTIDTEEVTNAFVVDRETGNVGIGRKTPTKKLQVEGDISASGHIHLEKQKAIFFRAGHSAPFISSSDAPGYADLTIRAADDINVIADDVHFRDNSTGTVTMTVANHENFLGIGNTSPSKKLTVGGEISASGDLTISDGTRELQYDVSAHALKSSGATLDFNGTDFSFNTNDLFIDQSTSRVGVGTNIPAAELEVVGDIFISSSTPALRLRGPGVQYGQINHDTSDNKLLIKGWSGTKVRPSSAGASGFEIEGQPSQTGDLLYISSNGNTGDLLFVSASGKVGIGTATPDTELDVAQTGSFGQINLLDDKKILLGTGRDLQIYHSGTNSFIHEAGTGNLKILASNLDIQDKDGADYIKAIDNSGVTIYFNNSERFQTQLDGVSITGHLTASKDFTARSGSLKNLIVGDSDYTTTEASGSIPTSPFTVQATALHGTTDLEVAKFVREVRTDIKEGNAGYLRFGLLDTSGAGPFDEYESARIQWEAKANSEEDTSFLSFWTSHDNTLSQQMTINNLGNVGIGTTSPDYRLDVSASSGTSKAVRITSDSSADSFAQVLVEGNAAGGAPGLATAIDLRSNIDYRARGIMHSTATGSENERWFAGVPYVGGGYQIGFSDAASNNLPHYKVSSSLFIREDGNIGIGTSVPATKLQVVGSISASGTIHAQDTIDMTNNKSIRWPYLDINSSIRAESGHLKYTTSHGDHIFRSGSTDLVIFKDTGNVGINTTTPGDSLPPNFNSTTPRILEIKSQTTSVDSGLLLRRSDGNTGLDLWSDSNNGKVFIDSIHNDDNSYMIFRTRTKPGSSNEREALVIRGSGNIGIGTNSPTKKLQVAGEISSSGDITTQGDITTDGDLFVNKSIFIGNGVGDYANDAMISSSAEKLQISDNGNIDIIIDKNNTGANGKFSVKAHSTQTPRLVVSSSGNVGIGKTDPAHLLDIKGSSPLIGFYGSGDEYRALIGTGGSVITDAGVNDFGIRAGQSDGNVLFSAGGTTERMRITSDGNVGIGVTDPDRPLEVVSDGDYLAKFYSTDNKAIIEIRDNDTTGMISAENDKLSLGAYPGVNANNLNIDLTNDRVGIGTSSPSEKLDVDGNVKIHEELFIEGDINASASIVIKEAGDLRFDDLNTLSSSNASQIHWDFTNDDVRIYAHQSKSDATSMVFEMTDNVNTGDTFTYWFNNYLGTDKNNFLSSSDAFPLHMDGTKAVINHYYDPVITSLRDDTPLHRRMEAGNIDFYVLKKDATHLTASLLHADVSRDSVLIQGTITASGDISSSGTIFADRFESAGGDDTIEFDDALRVTGQISSSGKGFFGDDLRITDGARSLTYDVSGNSLALNGSNSIITAGAYNLKFLANTDGNTATTEAFTFSTGSNAVPLMIMQADGKIGIGTTSPSDKLEVYGNGEHTGIRIHEDAGTHEVSLHLRRGGSDWEIINNNELTIEGEGVERFRIDTAGRVGIGTNDPSEILDVVGNIKARDKITSTTFESGFEGSGFRLETGSSGTKFTVDDLTVRGTMSVYEMLIHQIRATNGSLFVSNTGKIISSSLNSVAHKKYELFFDTGSNKGYGHTFQKFDLIRSQRFVPSTNGSGSQVFKSDLNVVSTNGTASLVAVLTGSDAPQPGYEYVRIGSMTDSDRQGSIYLTSDDDHAPFIDVADGIDAHSDFNTSGRVKVRMGKLDGITTANSSFGTLDKYGFYASGSAYLEGSINATEGRIGGFELGANIISSSNGALILRDNGTITGSEVQFTGGDVGGWGITDTTLTGGDTTINSSGVITLGTGNDVVKLSSAEATYRLWIGHNTTTSAPFSVTKAGALKSTSGTIGGWNIYSDKIFTGTDEDVSGYTSAAGRLILSSSGAIHAKGFYVTKDGNASISGSVSASAGNIGGWTLNSTSLTGENITLDSTNNKGEIELGNATSLNGGGTGIYMNGNGLFRVGGNRGNGERFIWDGTNFQLTASKLDVSGSEVKIEAPTFLLGDVQSQFISGSGGDIVISGSNFHLFKGNVTASNVDLTGKITATEGSFTGTVTANDGTIGGWTIDSSVIQKTGSSSTDGIVIDSSNKVIQVHGASGTGVTANSRANARLLVGQVSTADFGIKGFGDGGERVFELSDNRTEIAGFEFTQNQIAKNNITMSNADGGKITLNQGTIFLSGSGEGQLADGNITFDKNGDTTISGQVTMSSNVLIQGGIEIGAFPEMPGTENLVGYWSFDESEGRHCLDQSGNNNTGSIKGNPTRISGSLVSGSGLQSSGSIVGNALHFDGSGDCVAITGSMMDAGSTDFTVTAWINPDKEARMFDMIACQRADGDGEGWQFDLRSGSYGEGMGLGFAIDDGPAAVTVNGNLDGSFIDSGSWHFVAATVDRMDGRIKTYHNAVFQNQSATLESIDTDVKNDAPFCIGGKLNSNADTSVANGFNGYIDDVRVYNKVLTESELRAIYLNPGGTKTTKISGDQITTGKLKSNNLSSTEGSVFDLDGGTFKLGGESSPNLSFDGSTLEVDGTLSSSVGNIGGWTIDNTSLTAGDTTISSSGLINVGTLVGVGNQGSTNTGFRVNSSGEVLIKQGGANSNYIRFDNGNLDIVTEAFELLDGNVEVSGTISSSKGSIGGFTIDTTEIKSNNASGNTGLRLKASGQITASDAKITGDIVATTITANTSGEIGGFTIDANHISANSDKIVLDSAANNGEIRMGGATNLTTGNGFYANGNGSFRAGDAADNYIKKDGDGLQIKTDPITLDSDGNLTISGTLSSSIGNIGGFTLDSDEIKSKDNTSLLLKSDGQITASNANISGSIFATDVNLTGIISSSAGNIANWTISNNTLKSKNNNAVLDGNNEKLYFGSKSGPLSSTEGAFIGKSGNDYYIAVGDTANNGGGIVGLAGNTSTTLIFGEFNRANGNTDAGAWIKYTNSDLQVRTDAFKLLNGNLTVSGTVSSSQGNIGGFTIDSDEIKSNDNTSLLFKSSGQITASSAFISGEISSSAGNIGGFTISGSKLQSGDAATNGIDINAKEGIKGLGVNAASEIETLGGEFQFAEAHHSIPPGEGGNDFDAASNELQSSGNSDPNPAGGSGQ